MCRVLIFFIFLFYANSIFACSCDFVGIEDAYEEVPDVYVIEAGEMRKVSTTHKMVNINGEPAEDYIRTYNKSVGYVVETLKGNPLPAIYMYGGDGMCSMPVTEGEKYVVFMYSPGETSFSVCSPNRSLKRVPQELLRKWRKSTSNKSLKQDK